MSIILHYAVLRLVEIRDKLGFFATTKISGILVVNIFNQLLNFLLLVRIIGNDLYGTLEHNLVIL